MPSHKFSYFRAIAAFGSLAVCMIAFQNCGGKFHAADNPSVSSASVQNPSPVPASASKPTFLLGRPGGIDALELDPVTDRVTILPSTAFGGQNVGWMVYEPNSHTVFASEEGSGHQLQLYSRDAAAKTLTAGRLLSLLVSNVHLVLTASPFHLFAASYDSGELDHYTLNSDFSQLSARQSFGFGPAAKVHSNAFDASRGLLFTAVLGLNKISVKHIEVDGSLSAVGDIMIASPRMVMFDSTYDKLYVVTEASTGTSVVQAYSVSVSGSNYSFNDEGSLVIPLSGAALKVNHKYRFVMATAREAGKESVWGMPVTATGVKDTSRMPFNIPLTQALPRSMELSADDGYAVVAMQSTAAENVVVLKLSFDASLNYVSSTQIFAQKIGNYGYDSSLSLPSE